MLHVALWVVLTASVGMRRRLGDLNAVDNRGELVGSSLLDALHWVLTAQQGP